MFDLGILQIQSFIFLPGRDIRLKSQHLSVNVFYRRVWKRWPHFFYTSTLTGGLGKYIKLGVEELYLFRISCIISFEYSTNSNIFSKMSILVIIHCRKKSPTAFVNISNISRISCILSFNLSRFCNSILNSSLVIFFNMYDIRK